MVSHQVSPLGSNRPQLPLGLGSIQQKEAIHSKLNGRNISNWIKPVAGGVTIFLCTAFAAAIMSTSFAKPAFDASVLGISLGSAAGALFLFGNVGGVIAVSYYGHTANKQSKLIKDLKAKLEDKSTHDTHIIDIIKAYASFAQSDLIQAETDWVNSLKAELKSRAKIQIKKTEINAIKPNERQKIFDKLRDDYVRLSGLTWNEIYQHDVDVAAHLEFRPTLKAHLFPA